MKGTTPGTGGAGLIHDEDEHANTGNDNNSNTEATTSNLLSPSLSSSSTLPFDQVIISFPEENAAKAATIELDRLSQAYGCPFLATTDPRGVRVGSGGAVLDVILRNCKTNNDESKPLKNNSSILLILAGGESSRCPTQMILGKAWTSLPIKVGTTPTLTTPLELGLKLFAQWNELPSASLVVLAGDTLLQLLPSHMSHLQLDLPSYNNIDVIGVAVPAPCEIAQNHGVYVLEDHVLPDDDQASVVVPCLQVWQKPSLSNLHEISTSNNMAWIDTGVVVFLPHVVQALYQLATRYFPSPLEITEPSSTLPQRRQLPKLDLYTHLLQALKASASVTTDNDSSRRELYCHSFSSHEQELVSLVWDAVSQYALHIRCFPRGEFLHLGTTRELLTFLNQSSTPATWTGAARDNGENGPTETTSTTTTDAADLIRHRVGQSLPLVRRLETFTQGVDLDPTVVTCHVLWQRSNACDREPPTKSSTVGPRSVLEHCHVQMPMKIGSDCLISGLRPVTGLSQWEIPNRTMVQMVSYGQQNDDRDGMVKDSSSAVLVVLGMDDDIKSPLPHTRLFGRPIADFWNLTHLRESDLWHENESTKHLWTAKLHPILSSHSTTTTFDWLSDYVTTSAEESLSESVLERIQEWKSADRLSLRDVRDLTESAAMEFDFRRSLMMSLQHHKNSFYQHLKQLLLERTFEPLDWRWIVEEFQATGHRDNVMAMLSTLDEVVVGSLTVATPDLDAQYDVCGRACRVSCAFLHDLHESCLDSEKSDGETLDSSLNNFDATTNAGTETILNQYNDFVSQRDDAIRNQPVAAFQKAASAVASLGQVMTSRCILGQQRQCLPWRAGTQDPPKSLLDRWVIATAPARVDLAGGWTDTPPICLEYGSLVTGIAVLVDELRPLSCRCRIVSGSSGILLRSESRDGTNGALLSNPVEVRLNRQSDLDDYNNPLADCALMKCALVLLGLPPTSDTRHNGSVFQSTVNAFCRSDDNVGLEIVASSLLPHGSGLGTSSILGGCVIACIEQCLGYHVTPDGDFHGLIEAVLKLEQLLTTGGGFQDQVNGLVGGAKAVACERLAFPIKLSIEQLQLEESTKLTLSEHLILVFTGKTRLAKNLLQNVLHRWSTQTAEIRQNVAELATCAKVSRKAMVQGDVNEIGQCLSKYWSQKKLMAGPNSGVEPPQVELVMKELASRGAIRGASLCGAGGGGFMVLLTSDGFTEQSLRSIVEEMRLPSTSGFTWHNCTFSDEGLQVKNLQESVSSDSFQIAWHRDG